MKRIVITGALGHIGSRLIHGLPSSEYEEVVLLDNLSTQRYCSLFHLPKGLAFRFVEGDILTANLEKLFAGIDAVVHLAAITDAANSFQNEEQVRKVNFDGTRRIAQACLASGAKMIFVSTTSVYGTQESVVDETCSVEGLKPQSPYAESKLQAEQYLKSLGQNPAFRFATCRFGTIYGVSAGMRFHTAVNKFVWQACHGQPITVWTTALHQKRPYLDLGDAVEAIQFILRRNEFNNDVYNLVTDNTTVNEILELIKTRIPTLQIQFVDAKIMNQLSYTVLGEKFQKLGFRYQGSLKSGIHETIDLLRGGRN